MSDPSEPIATSTSSFRCPLCSGESSFNGRCPSCDVMFDDVRGALPWQLAPRVEAPGMNAARDIVLLTAIAVLSLVFAALFPNWGMRPLWTIPAAIAAYWIRRYFDYERVTLRNARRTHAKAVSTRQASTIHDGQRVVFSGVPIVRAFALAEEGMRAIACIRNLLVTDYSFDPPTLTPPIRSRKLPRRSISGGEFELHTEDGTTVRVRLDHFVLLRGEKTNTSDGTAEIIAEGSPVRVSGVARWVDDHERSGMRSTGRVLLLEGTKDNPIVIEPVALDHWIDAQPTTEKSAASASLKSGNNAQSTEVAGPRTGVRASVDNEHDKSESTEGELRSESRTEETRTGVQKR
jgi:hypothetical protein